MRSAAVLLISNIASTQAIPTASLICRNISDKDCLYLQYNGGALSASGAPGGGYESLGKSNPDSFEVILALLRLADMMALSYAKQVRFWLTFW